MAAATARLVLDTNACLDLFVFGDPRAAALGALLARGDAQAVDDDDCRGEWLRVLRYPDLALDAAAIAAAHARHAELVCRWDGPGRPPGLPPLPRCRDPDDQKFLELAARCGARVLVTRDASLLRLSRRTQAIAGFVVLQPQAAVAMLEDG
jgi:predicted nucleic acid-binding protein